MLINVIFVIIVYLVIFVKSCFTYLADIKGKRYGIDFDESNMFTKIFSIYKLTGVKYE